MNNRSAVLLSCGLLAAVLTGCEQRQAQETGRETPAIPVSKPIVREVTEYVDFTGRTDAVFTASIRPRVTGYIVNIPFKEGAEVKKNDILFEIDPRPYQTQFNQAQSQINLYQSQYDLARTVYHRDQQLARSNGAGTITQEQLDTDKATMDQAEAMVKAAKANLETYRLNLEFCKVTSPIDGQVSRYYLTVGNLVNQDSTLLTTVVSSDPMYAYFDLDEPTLLRIRTAIKEGKIQWSDEENVPVFMGLQGEEGYPHRGTIDFMNNAVNPSTGTIATRGVFENPPLVKKEAPSAPTAVSTTTAPNSSSPNAGSRRPPKTQRLLSPGMFVRIRLPIGKPHKALLVADKALGSDQGLKYLYVVGPDHKAEYRRVTTGPLQEDGLRVIEGGITADDWVVTGSIQQVRSKMELRPDQQPMPIPGTGQPADKGKQGEGGKKSGDKVRKQ